MKVTGSVHRRTPAWCWFVLLAAAAVLSAGRKPVAGMEEGRSGSAEAETATPAEKAAAPRAADEPWLVVPVTTELQRALVGSDAQAFVLVNGDAVTVDRVMVDAQKLNLEGLAMKLVPYRGQKATVYFDLPFSQGRTHFVRDGDTVGFREGPPGTPRKPSQGRQAVLFALEGLARRAGFRDVKTRLHFHSEDKPPDWGNVFSDLKKAVVEDAGRDEPSIGDDQFKVYAIRTSLSRFMFGDVDCVLHILPSADGSGREVEEKVQRYVAQLKLERKESILVLYPGPVDVRFLGDQTFYKEQLGFQRMVPRLQR